MKKKKIIDKGSLLALLGVFVIANMIIYFICIKFPCIQEWITLSSDSTRSITSMQITISLVSITIMILFLGSANERILGISFKKIFFHRDFWKFINITNCIFLMLIIMVCSVVSSLLLVNIDFNRVCLLGKIICVVSLFYSIFLLFNMISLGLILEYKQSRIYNRIYKTLENKKNLQTYHEIVEKIDFFEIEKNKYRQYIMEECIILSYICLNISDFESNISEQERILRKIICKIGNMIKEDPRDNSFLLLKLYEKAKETFKEEKAKDLFCCKFIDE